VRVISVAVDDRPVFGTPRATAADWDALRRLVAEALLLQDSAEELIRSLRARPDPSEVARPGGRLKSRFFALLTALPDEGDPELVALAQAVRQVLDHHLLMLITSLDLLAAAQLREVLDHRLDDCTGLGDPARRLEALRLELMLRD
jgi:hypothetical protein